jgi:hypothetical protein
MGQGFSRWHTQGVSANNDWVFGRKMGCNVRRDWVVREKAGVDDEE